MPIVRFGSICVYHYRPKRRSECEYVTLAKWENIIFRRKKSNAHSPNDKLTYIRGKGNKQWIAKWTNYIEVKCIGYTCLVLCVYIEYRAESDFPANRYDAHFNLFVVWMVSVTPLFRFHLIVAMHTHGRHCFWFTTGEILFSKIGIHSVRF